MHLRPSRMRPLNSSTIMTSSALTTYSLSFSKRAFALMALTTYAAHGLLGSYRSLTSRAASAYVWPSSLSVIVFCFSKTS